MKRAGTLVLTILSITATGCGENAQPATSPNPPAASPTHASVPKNTSAAVHFVRDGLPDIPLYKGARFAGTAISDTEVCVDTTLTKEASDAVGVNRTSHVVVSFPDLNKGEPMDGLCAKRAETADKAIEASKRFYLRMDDDALALDDAVKAAQDGKSDAGSRIARLRARILNRVNRYLLDGGDESIGGNLLLSAATTAREAADAGNIARLADQRREIADARAKLADEAIK